MYFTNNFLTWSSQNERKTWNAWVAKWRGPECLHACLPAYLFLLTFCLVFLLFFSFLFLLEVKQLDWDSRRRQSVKGGGGWVSYLFLSLSTREEKEKKLMPEGFCKAHTKYSFLRFVSFPFIVFFFFFFFFFKNALFVSLLDIFLQFSEHETLTGWTILLLQKERNY